VPDQGLTERSIKIAFELNGSAVEVESAPEVALIDLLRDGLLLKGAKRSCDMQVCGACTVLVDGAPVSSCTVLAFEVRGKRVLTIEGVAADEALTYLSDAFIDNAALQCGFCTPGMILAAKSLLDGNASPSEAEIKDYMRGNICRCTGYKKIVEAIQEAARIAQDGARA
jgi:carbon-monoxide dehydrogenase small subunit